MASRAYPNPVQTVARAARFRTVRNALVAAGAVLTAAFGVTATVVWPIGQHAPASCSADRALVAVHPFALPLDAAGRWMSASGHSGPASPPPVVTGCLDRADLVPAAPTVPTQPMSAAGQG
ncbi:MAG TPA: hypothetical protein VFX70_15600 [Mycobacteriales bacterium]|nr:hypothetical protein [Mycobacteriales bacterium]